MKFYPLNPAKTFPASRHEDDAHCVDRPPGRSTDGADAGSFPHSTPPAPIPHESSAARAPLAEDDSTPLELNTAADAPTAADTLRIADCRLPMANSPDRDVAACPAPQSEIGNRKSAIRQKDWLEAEASAALCEAFAAEQKSGLTLRQAARAVGKSPSYFSGADCPYARWQREGVAGLLPRRRESGAKPEMIVPPWFIPAAKYFWLLINRNRQGGSVPEAIRRVISLPLVPVGWREGDTRRFERAMAPFIGHRGEKIPVCPPELREAILARQSAGQPLVTVRLSRQITQSLATVAQHRNPTEAGLGYLSAPGTMMWNHKSTSGEPEFIRSLDQVEADDGTINFPVCVPWTMGGCPCSDRYGVKVGRFQFLRPIDKGSRYRPGFVYVARPSGSYRREDVLTLMRMVCRAIGIPKTWVFEQGTWKSNIVKEAVRLLGCDLQTVYSPRQKPFVEGGFNQDWTKLSVHFPNADVGRFMGETEEANLLLAKCKRGTEDPRQHFPMLAVALAAFDEITREQNATPVTSVAWGRWVPQERLAAHCAANPPRQLDPASDWIFSPYVREWTVRGNLVGGRVPLFEEVSVPFDFAASWLPQFHGAKVRVHFDPSEPRCQGKIVLAQNHGRHTAGDVLGDAMQINETAGYARLVMGWGDDPASLGRIARQQAASALRREVREILPRNGPTQSGTSEMRDGLGNKAVITHGDHSIAPAEGERAGVRGFQKPAIGNPKSAIPLGPDAEELARLREETARFEADNPHLFV